MDGTMLLKDKIKTTLTRLKNGNWQCMCPQCTDNAIKSHVFQKSSILEPIANNGKLYNLHYDIFHGTSKGLANYEERGIKDTDFTFKGFCEKHDNTIFAPIEKGDMIDWCQPISQYLLSYRSLCRELYVNRLVSSIIDEHIERLYSIDFCARYAVIQNNIELLESNKNAFERSISIGDFSHYSFETIVLPFKFELCLSSPIVVHNDCVPLYFVNIFPYRNKTIIIIGNLSNVMSVWGNRILSQLKSNDHSQISLAIMDIIHRGEFHCMSYSLYNSIQDLPKFLGEWNQNIQRFDLELKYTNIFDDIIKNLIDKNMY